MSVPCEPDCACDGRCCAVFYFPRTPREIGEHIERDGGYNGQDGRMIQDMLVPLTVEEAGERAERFGIDKTKLGSHNLYTCRHWDEETRLCTVHSNRPTLCRDYPYGKKCGHGCGWGEEETQPLACKHNVILGRE